MEIQKNDHIVAFMNHLHIQIVDSGYASVGSDWNSRHVCSPYSRIYLILSGQGTVSFSSMQMLLHPRHIYLIPAGLTFDYACQDSMRQLYFHLTVQMADGFDLLARLNTCLDAAVSSDDMAAALRCYRGQTLADAMILQQMILRFLSSFIAASELGRSAWQTYSPFLHQLYSLVRQSVGSKTTIRDLAEQLSMSESTLTKRFKAETGLTIGQYMDHLLFLKAQQLLLYTDGTIAQIAEDLGFCDQFYFSRYFRQRQRETPSHYRKRLRIQI